MKQHCHLQSCALKVLYLHFEMCKHLNLLWGVALSFSYLHAVPVWCGPRSFLIQFCIARCMMVAGVDPVGVMRCL